MKNRINNYRDDTIGEENCESTPTQKHDSQDVREQGLLDKTTDSIIALAKHKPIAVVVVGVAAGLIVGWLTKRNA